MLNASISVNSGAMSLIFLVERCKDENKRIQVRKAAEILGCSNTRKALAAHVDDEDKTDGVTIRDFADREQNPVFINERRSI